MENKTLTIHQFTPTVAFGDGVANGVLFTQKLLREFGFISEIFICSTHVDMLFQHNVTHIDEYKPDKNQILIYHCSIGHEYHDQIMSFDDQKILVYHNITPSHFFKDNIMLQKLCDQGREQLKKSNEYFIGSYADSFYNCEELEFYNYKNPTVLPLLIHYDKIKEINVCQDILKKHDATYNILFVGRIVSNKCQHQLVDVIYYLKQQNIKNIKLFIVGGVSQPAYNEFLHNYVNNLGLASEIEITGKVSDIELNSYYANADLYLSLSEHEGFGIPLIEAMKYDIPVLSFNIGGIPTTIGELGLLNNKAANYVSQKIIKIMNDPNLRTQYIRYQKNHLKKFTYQNAKNNLKDYLNTLNIQTPITHNPKTQTPINHNPKLNIQLEGPFDSSYSLAIVNKEIALALDKNGKNVKLYSTEGYGDFEPNETFLKENTDVNDLYSKSLDSIDLTIRYTYPPRSNAMYGSLKVIGPYGWEESEFPKEYVDQFNRRLSMLFCMSSYVKDTMINNGVKIPMFNTGIIVNRTKTSKKLNFELPTNFKILHISSAFPRKGVDVLLNAFDSLKNSLNISLVIKTFPNPHNTLIEDINTLNFKEEKLLEKDVYLYAKQNKEILLINKDLSEEEINHLYKSCDVLVAPSFGEGFGLPMAEAMLFDLPVITTGYGGQVDFCTNDTSWLIDFEFAIANTHLSLPNSVWVKPLQHSLEERILEVYNLPQKDIKSKTKLAKQNIVDNYSQDKIVINISESLDSFDSYKKVKANIAVVSTYNTKCGIAKYAKYLLTNFENESLHIFANRDKNIILKDESNIIRCWSDGENINQNLEELKENLLAYKINRLIIQYNFSFFPLLLLDDLLNFCLENDIEAYVFFHSVKDVKIGTTIKSLKSISKALQKVTRIMVHSVNDLNILKSFDIYKNTMLFPHGIDDRLFAPAPNPQHLIPENPTISTFGFLLPHKGIMELIEATEILHEEGIKVKLLLLNSIHPAPVSMQEKNKIEDYINNSKIKEYITMNNNFLKDEEIIRLLAQSQAVVFPYQDTQETSSAAVRLGLLTLKEVITTPLNIFDDIKQIVTQTKDQTPTEIAKTIKNVINKKEHNVQEKKEYMSNLSWTNLSTRLLNMMIRD